MILFRHIHMMIKFYFAVFSSFFIRIRSKISFFTDDNPYFTTTITNHDKYSVGKTTAFTRWCIGTTQ